MKREYCHEEKVRRIKLALLIFSAALLTVLIGLTIFLIVQLKDSNRSTYKTRELEYSEIVKKNYIKGFKDSENSREFSYILPNDDINELLSIGTKTLNDKHIESIYFDVDESNNANFYVDLNKTIIKTRAVIKTTPVVKDQNSYYLKISECKIGKANALTYLTNKGYLTSEFLDDYFEKCHLPISYHEDKCCFEINPLKWIDSFPSTNIGDEIFKDAKSVPSAYSLNANLFGFNLNLEKLRHSSDSFINVTTSDTPDLFESVKTGCISTFDSMSSGETSAAYSLSEEGLNKIIKSSFISTQKEEIASSLTTDKVVYDLKGINVKFNSINQISFKLFYSVNNYLIDRDVHLTFISYSSNNFIAHFQVETVSSNMSKISINKVMHDLSNSFDYFSYQETNKVFTLDLQSLNSHFSDFDLKTCQKWIEVNPSTHCIDFKITK